MEKNSSGTYTQIQYGPTGKVAIMNGQTEIKAYIPLPGGGKLVTNPDTFWHPDWLGSVRLGTSVSQRTATFDRAFAPYGEVYNSVIGNATDSVSFTGLTQDTVGDEFDTPARELHPVQARWISPDPAGVKAVSLASPQTWNRYSYVGNSPLNSTDPSGLVTVLTTAQMVAGAPLMRPSQWGDPFSVAAIPFQTNPQDQNTTPPEPQPQEEQQEEQAQNNVAPAATVVPYDTHGATASEAMTNAASNGPNAPYVGSTNPGNVSAQPSVTECGAGVCTANVTVVSFGQITISAPRWVEFSQASATEKAAWNASLSSLYHHENGHVKHAKDIHAREGFALQHLGATGSTGAAAIQNLNAKIRAVFRQYDSLFRQWSAAYDQRTCHGECQ